MTLISLHLTEETANLKLPSHKAIGVTCVLLKTMAGLCNTHHTNNIFYNTKIPVVASEQKEKMESFLIRE